MFYSVTGNIVHIDASSVAVECGGVAFRCSCSLNTLKTVGNIGSQTTLYTYLAVREDALELFGFKDMNELDCFKLLIGISGVGPKAALAVLSEMTPDKLAMAVASGDAKSVTKAQGIGPKIAQRIVLELKGKLTAVTNDVSEEFDAVAAVNASDNTQEAVSALQFLGYSKYEAAKAVSAFDKNLSVEELIKKALTVLSKNL
ncbi:MAG: Holliday junction branch migration protein RuvA [Clostridia bacterium]|nr:Holliday junction branch migration protein RuvA [Clostridia bacterium]